MFYNAGQLSIKNFCHPGISMFKHKYYGVCTSVIMKKILLKCTVLSKTKNYLFFLHRLYRYLILETFLTPKLDKFSDITRS